MPWLESVKTLFEEFDKGDMTGHTLKNGDVFAYVLNIELFDDNLLANDKTIDGCWLGTKVGLTNEILILRFVKLRI